MTKNIKRNIKKNIKTITLNFLLIILTIQNIITTTALDITSTGTEYIVFDYNIPVIYPLFKNTTIFLDINHDNIIDYQFKLKNLTKINPPWYLRPGSIIKSSKPIIYKEQYFNKKILNNQVKKYCYPPDLINLKKNYLLKKGEHNLISPTENKITIYYSNKTIKKENLKKFEIKKITINKDYAILVSEQPIISTSNCLDPIATKETYTTENNIIIYVINKTKFIFDYNNDNIIDEIKIISNKTELKNIAPGTHIYTNNSITILQEFYWENRITEELKQEINSFNKKTDEKILFIPDFDLKTEHAQITYLTSNITKNKVQLEYPLWIIGKPNIGFESTEQYLHRTHLTISNGLVSPQLSMNYFNDQINIFNPTKNKTYLNLTLKLNKDTNYQLKTLTDDNIILKNKTKNKTLNLQKLYPNTYLIINSENINQYNLSILE